MRSGHPTAYWELRVLSGFLLLEQFLEPSGLWAERPKLRLLNRLCHRHREWGRQQQRKRKTAAKRDSTRQPGGAGRGGPAAPQG